jgi:chorismate mutase
MHYANELDVNKDLIKDIWERIHKESLRIEK